MADESSTSQGGRDAAELTVPRLLGISIGIRLIFDTGVQIFNPFLPLIATGLNISEVMLGSLVGLRSLTGLTSPFFGALGDRRGYRLVMRLGLLLGGSGALIVGLSQAWLLTIVGMLIWGVGIAAFTPSLHAYLSARLPYAQRARGIGILEYSWALAGIVGLYLVGFLIEWQGWRAPFFVLGLLMLISSAIIWLFFSPVDRSEDGNAVIGAETGAEVASQSRPTAPTPLSLSTRINDFFALGENQRSAYANMFGSSLLFFGAIQMMITHGLWLRTEYGLGAVQLGTVALVMGVSDLCGSVGVSLFADRVGKRRSVMVGAMGALLGYLMMPFLDTSVYAAVFSLAFARGTFEYGIVSNISLLSEQVPAQRGKVFTLAGALNLLVGATAGATGPWIYQTVGVSGLAAVSTVATIICLIIYWGWVRESKSVA